MLINAACFRNPSNCGYAMIYLQSNHSISFKINPTNFIYQLWGHFAGSDQFLQFFRLASNVASNVSLFSTHHRNDLQTVPNWSSRSFWKEVGLGCFIYNHVAGYIRTFSDSGHGPIGLFDSKSNQNQLLGGLNPNSTAIRSSWNQPFNQSICPRFVVKSTKHLSWNHHLPPAESRKNPT